jgi:DNA-binding NarL/FixJ family response regulator
MTMPNMTGDRLAREMLSDLADFPLVLCTRFSHRMDEKTATKIGIKGFAMKPFVKSEFANVVRKVLVER